MKKIILILFILLLSGCYDYNELTNLGIVSSLIVDYEENLEEYTVYLEVLETKKEVTNPSFFWEGKGPTFELALTDAYNKSFKHIFLNHLNIVILNSNLSQDNLKDVYNYFTANTKVSKETDFIMSSNIKELLSFKTTDNTANGDTIKNMVHYNEIENAKFKTSQFSEILHNYLNDAPYFLGNLEIEEKNLILGSSYILDTNGNKKIVDENAVLVANILDKSAISYNIALKNAYQVYDSKPQIEIGKDKITVKLKTSVRLLAPPDYDINNEDTIVSVNEKLGKYLKEMIQDGINYAKSIDIDIYKFDSFYQKYKPKTFKPGIWKNLDYEIIVDAKLNEKGIVLNRMDDDNAK